MAKIDVKAVLKDLDGKALKGQEKDGKAPDMTLKDVCKGSLLAYDEKHSGEEKYERYKLAQKLEASKDGIVDFKAEEITKIKEAIGKYQFPIVVGIAWDLLEGK